MTIATCGARIGAAVLTAVSALVASTASAWQPTQTVEIVAGSSAGGALDRTARQVQLALGSGKIVGQPIIVVDKPGAGSAIAWDYIDRHAGDGHYLSIAIPGLLSNLPMGLSKQSFRDFTPLAILSSEYIVFAVPSSSSINSAADLLAAIRADPARLNIGVATALGGANHLAVCKVMQAAGVDISKLHFIVYRSSADAVAALLGSTIDLVAASASNVIPALDSGRIRAVATTSPQRMSAPLQKIPTWKEQGVDVTFASWRGVVGPKNMTTDQISFWDDALSKMSRSDAWKKALATNLEEASYMKSSDARVFLEGENSSLLGMLSRLGLAK